jgi:hypothetical protein
MGVALASLGVNIYVLKSLRPFSSGEVHLRAAWIFSVHQPSKSNSYTQV